MRFFVSSVIVIVFLNSQLQTNSFNIKSQQKIVEKIIANSAKETQKIATDLVEKILQQKKGSSAVVLGLSGNLGAGKTTFLQGFAKALGITEVVNSPTFVIMKRFKIPYSRFQIPTSNFQFFYHFDCYRLEDPKEILELGFAEIILDPKNIVAIEWPEKIGDLLPKDAIEIKFGHLEEAKREIIIGK